MKELAFLTIQNIHDQLYSTHYELDSYEHLAFH